jgi:myo-inositol-1(or 4)-monophosphatase
MNEIDLSGDAEVAIGAAWADARVVRDLYGRPLTRIDKGAGDFATAARSHPRRVMRPVMMRMTVLVVAVP